MNIQFNQFLDDSSTEPARGFGALESKRGNLPLRQLSYHTRVLALATHTTIVQTFVNPFSESIEAKYLFPMAIGQAVVACEMRVGQRVIVAELKERQAARAEYQQALESGHRAALLEENRPETFLMSVGNIAPGEAVQICIQTVHQMTAVDGQWTLRLPLVVAPRYTSGIPLPRSASGPGVTADTDQVPDASTVTPPTWLTGFKSPIDLRIVVDLDMGQLPCVENWIEQLTSSLHTVVIEESATSAASGSKTCRLQINPGERVNRDFILRGQILTDRMASGLVCESTASSAGTDQRATFALTLVPPRRRGVQHKDVLYLIDRSGSMSGWKIAAARRGVANLLGSLQPGDRFRLIAFDDSLDAYHAAHHGKGSEDWIEVTDQTILQARSWLQTIDVKGGTELGAAIHAGLSAFRRQPSASDNRSRAIVLITDGQVAGEDSVLRVIETLPQECLPRMYCLGIDVAVNGGLLKRIADRTSGTAELVESEARMQDALNRFGNEIGNPALTEVTITDPSNESVDLAPLRINTLYEGRTQVIYGRCRNPAQLSLKVRGRLSDGKWYEEQVGAQSLSGSTASVLLPLWGKERVRSLEDRLFSLGQSDKHLQREIVACSLECHVLSRLTAFVAVDHSHQVRSVGPLHSVVVPSEMPEGWDMPIPQLDSACWISGKGDRNDVEDDVFEGMVYGAVANFARSQLNKLFMPPKQDAATENIVSCGENAAPFDLDSLSSSKLKPRRPEFRLSRGVPRAVLSRGATNRSLTEMDEEMDELVKDLFDAALKQQATHIFAVWAADALRIYLVIAGRATLHLMPRLIQAYQVLQKIVARAQLSSDLTPHLRSSALKHVHDSAVHQLKLHIIDKGFLIEMPAAVDIPMPACVNDWWVQHDPTKAPVA